VRDAPVRHMTLLADSDARAWQHARLLSRRPGLRAATLLRWFEWEGFNWWKDFNWDALAPWEQLHRLEATGRHHASLSLVDNLALGLHSLVIGEFALTRGTIARLDRCAVSVISIHSQHASKSSALGVGHSLDCITQRPAFHTDMIVLMAGSATAR